MEKQCNKCGEIKSLEMFCKNKTTNDGHGRECKQCTSERHKAMRLANPEKYKQAAKKWREANPNYINQWKQRNKKRTKIQKRKEYLKSTYGISLEQYEEMRIAQQYKCYICNRHEDEIPNAGSTALNVDHCHDTGIVRKLLCMSCNIALGKVNDDVEILQRCIDYVKEHQ